MKMRLIPSYGAGPGLQITGGFSHYLYACLPLISAAKKVFFFILGCQLILLTGHAQTAKSHRRENFDVHKFRTASVTMPAPASTISLNNIQGITVIDARADTTVVGFMQKKTIDPFSGVLNNAIQNQTEQRVNRRPTFILLDRGLQQATTQFAERSFSFPNNSPLPGVLMVIKKLWLSDELNFDKAPQGDARFTGPASRDVWTSGIDVKIEFYLDDKTGYYPLYRYDSVITERMTVSEYAPEFIATALRLSLQKLLQMDNRIDAVKARKKFTLEDIRLHNENDFNVPALVDTVLKKGVYMTFDEFKNNNPSQVNYELKQDKLTDIIYIKQSNGTAYPERGVWGYCNGENAFIKSANNFFLLQRSANAFYIFGAKHIKRVENSHSNNGSYYSSNGGFAGPVYYTTSRTEIQLEPFQLDWSTGKLY